MSRICIVVLFFISFNVAGQNVLRDEWVKWIEDDSKKQALSHHLFFTSIRHLSPEENLILAAEVKKHCDKGDERLRLVGQSVHAILHFYYGKNKIESLQKMKLCYQQSIQIEAPYLQAEFGKICATMHYTISKENEAVQYAISSIKMTEYLGIENFGYQASFYIMTGETLLKTGYYEEALDHLLKGLNLSKKDSTVTTFTIISAYNDIGLVYRYIGNHRKAIEYFDLLRAYSKQVGRLDWVDIAYKNRLNSFVELNMLDSAKTITNWLLFSKKHFYEKDDKIIAFEMLGKIALKENNFHSAKAFLEKSIAENKGQNKSLLMRAYESLAFCYEKLGQEDKAYSYLKLTQLYNDSINHVNKGTKKQYLEAKANFDKEQLKLRSLSAEIKSVKKLRNLTILSLLVFAGGLMFYLIHKKNKVARLKSEVTKELEQFKHEIIQKDKKIDLLHEKINHQIHFENDAQAIHELSRQIILTEDDWQNFKFMFEKLYPSFFRKLTQKVPGITEAEKRMAALIKIQLTTKQIAAMLGISQDSVHKSRQRLRQRLGTDSSSELETIIGKIS